VLIKINKLVALSPSHLATLLVEPSCAWASQYHNGG
jgi:hypothetical protein